MSPRRATRERCVTPVGALVRGALAGLVGTAAMDLSQYLRYRAGGGTDELIQYEFAGVKGWEGAPAPAHVAKRVVEGLFQTELPDETANFANNVMHWSYGVGWAAVLGLVGGSARRTRPWWGPAFGSAVFLTSYAVLPPTGLYQPVWEYDATTLGRDWAAHLLYGTSTRATLEALLRVR